MQEEKFQSLKRREQKMQAKGLVCAVCEEKPANLMYKQMPICNECLNPSPNQEYHNRMEHHWTGLRSSLGDF